MKKKLIDIDSEFDAFEEFFDETKIKHATMTKNKIGNKAFSKTMSAAAKKRNQNEEYNKTHRLATQLAVTPESLEKRRQHTLNQWKDPEVTKKRMDAINAKCAKQIQTPDGIFVSQQAAIRHYKEKGLPNAGKKIEKWTKDPNNKDFYYI